jgi:hypothetical protein
VICLSLTPLMNENFFSGGEVLLNVMVAIRAEWVNRGVKSQGREERTMIHFNDISFLFLNPFLPTFILFINYRHCGWGQCNSPNRLERSKTLPCWRTCYFELFNWDSCEFRFQSLS